MGPLQLIANGALQAFLWLGERLEKRPKSRLQERASFWAIFRRAPKLTALKLRSQFTALPSPTHSFNAARAHPFISRPPSHNHRTERVVGKFGVHNEKEWVGEG